MNVYRETNYYMRYYVVKTWLCQGSRSWFIYDFTWRQGPMMTLVSFTLQRNLRTNMSRTQYLGYSPQPACSGWSAGFMSTCFYSSKVKPSSEVRFYFNTVLDVSHCKIWTCSCRHIANMYRWKLKRGIG